MSLSMAGEMTGDEMVAELAAGVGTRMQRRCLHRLHNHSAERSLRTNGRWKLSSLEQLVVHLVVNSQLLHLARHSQLVLLRAHLLQRRKPLPGPVRQL